MVQPIKHAICSVDLDSSVSVLFFTVPEASVQPTNLFNLSLCEDFLTQIKDIVKLEWVKEYEVDIKHLHSTVKISGFVMLRKYDPKKNDFRTLSIFNVTYIN